MKKKKIGRIKSSDHGFDLWFFGQLLDEAVQFDNVEGFCNLIDNNRELADEYFGRRMEKIEKVELPPEFDSEEWTRKMLSKIYRKIKERRENKRIDNFLPIFWKYYFSLIL